MTFDIAILVVIGLFLIGGMVAASRSSEDSSFNWESLESGAWIIISALISVGGMILIDRYKLQ